jgi:tetratricopeptide (TPR) repeat protein
MKASEDDILKSILDSNLEELLQHDLYTGQLSYPIECYLKVIINYLKADTVELEQWLQKVKELHKKDESDLVLKGIYFCSLVRFNIRTNNLVAGDLEILEVISLPEPWSIELKLVLGLAFLRMNIFDKSSRLFETSYKQYSVYGCKKKALIAYQNHVVSKLNLNPKNNYLAEWSFLVKLARKEKVTSMEGGALINLSREYQNIGSFEPALKAANEALESLSESTGTYQYYLALFQKCDLLIELGRNKEAFETYQEGKLCPFEELKPSLQLLERKMNPDRTMSSIPLPESLPWKERMEEMKTGTKIKQPGNLVQQLLSELENEPQDKFTLIEKLYPENIDFEVKDNRFKVLLSKIRKQYPGLVVKDGNYYKLEMTHQWLKKKIS